MKITTKKIASLAAAAALAVGLLGASAGAANAADGHWTPKGTPEPFFGYSFDTGLVIPSTTTLKYTDGVVGAPDALDPDKLFAEAPADAENVQVFIAPRGKESTLSEWSSSYFSAFKPNTRQVMQAPAGLFRFDAASFAAVKSAGGEYSLGFAYTKNNGVTFVGLGAFAHVTLTPGTADWTIDTATWVPDSTTPSDPPATGEIGVEAPVVAPEPPVDGPLELSIPADAKATLSGAKLVDGKSTATGLLPVFDVTDERVVSKKGWDATASVTEFVRKDGTEKIGADALAIVPKVVANGTTSSGVTAQAGFQGSATAKPFASADAGTGVGTTKLSANLTFVAPAGSVEGTYTSKVTVTVVSK